MATWDPQGYSQQPHPKLEEHHHGHTLEGWECVRCLCRSVGARGRQCDAQDSAGWEDADPQYQSREMVDLIEVGGHMTVIRGRIGRPGLGISIRLCFVPILDIIASLTLLIPENNN